MLNKKFTIVISVFVVAITAALSAAGVSAQGRYVGQLSRNDVESIIKRVEDSGDKFRNDFRREIDRSNLSGNQKRVYRNQVDTFENATDRLRSRFDREDSWWEARNEVQNMIRDARPLNISMNAVSFRRNVESQWDRLQNDINKLADTYDLPGIAGGGWNGGPWNPGNPGNPGGGNWGGQTSTPPNWAQGTFYSTYPAVTLTINRNGQITAVTGGQTYYGRFYRNQIYLNNDVSTISRYGNGVRTYNRNTGQTTDYTRNYGGGIGGGNNDGPMSSPPNWARGTFYSSGYPQVSLNIANNGRVTASTGGQTYYGRYYNGQIYLNNDVSTISRNGNGISTYNRNTGQTTVYRRR